MVPRGDAKDSLQVVVVKEQQKEDATTSSDEEHTSEASSSSESIYWQKIVDVRLADLDELPHRISRSILADFKLPCHDATTTGGDDILQNFLLQQIAAFTNPTFKISERRKSLDTVQSLLARIDKAAAATRGESSFCRQASANSTESSPSQVDLYQGLAGQQLPAADGVEQQSVPKASGLHGTNSMEVAPQSTIPLNRAERGEDDALPAAEHTATAVKDGCSSHDNDCVMDQSDEHEAATDGTRQTKDRHSTACLGLGPNDVVIGPLYGKIDNLGKALFEKTVHDYALSIVMHGHTWRPRKDVCRKIYSFLLASGVRFLQQESEATCAPMKKGNIRELLEMALSKAVKNRARKEQCIRPAIDARYQQNHQPLKTGAPTALEQPTTFVRKISQSQITKDDVLMARHCASPGNLYFKEQHYFRRKQGYDRHSCAIFAISRVRQNGGRFLKPADASGALWIEIGLHELLETIKKPEKDLTTTAGTVLFSTKGQPAGAPRAVERERFGGSSRERCRCTERDVLMGNFEFASSWPGNKTFAQLLDQFGRKYAHCYPGQKQVERKLLIARAAIKEIRRNGGSFLQHYEGKTGPETLAEMGWLQVDLNDVERSTNKLIPDAETQHMYQDSSNGFCNEVGQEHGDEGTTHSHQAYKGRFPSIPVTANGHRSPLYAAANTCPPDSVGTLGDRKFGGETNDPEVIDLTDVFDT